MLDVSTWELRLCFESKTERGLFQYFRRKVHVKATTLTHFCFNVSANAVWFPLWRRKCGPEAHSLYICAEEAHRFRQRGCCDECAYRACYRQKRRLSKTSSRKQRWHTEWLHNAAALFLVIVCDNYFVPALQPLATDFLRDAPPRDELMTVCISSSRTSSLLFSLIFMRARRHDYIELLLRADGFFGWERRAPSHVLQFK